MLGFTSLPYLNVSLRIPTILNVCKTGYPRHFCRRLSSKGILNPFSNSSQGPSSRAPLQKKTILLMGYPGSGKTTVGKILADKLELPFLDMDDDHLEPFWGMAVSEKLRKVGNEHFIHEEEKAFLNFHLENESVVALSGSNVMTDTAVEHAKTLGHLFYLDTHIPDIVNRLNLMKVDRIVHHNPSSSMAEILLYRQSFYERSYDVRVICEKGEEPDSVASKIASSYGRLHSSGLVSTRRAANSECISDGNTHATTPAKHPSSFLRATAQGLADDGGLYVPAVFPHFTMGQLDRLVDESYSGRALRILEGFLNPRNDVPLPELQNVINNIYGSGGGFKTSSVVPVRPFGNNGKQQVFLSELFHGPTASFKDLALQLFPYFFDRASQQNFPDLRSVILVATSGDTGSAVLDGFSKLKNSNTFILFPENGVSEVQKKQLTAHTSPGNQVVGVKGDFDFCQSAIKQILNDNEYNKLIEDSHSIRFSAANSINIARLLPQIVYHCSTYLDLVSGHHINLGDEVDVAIPTGNFGNILAAHYAKLLGVPFKRLICASNVNNVLHDFFTTGVYDISKRSLQVTHSPAIDILNSSNLERYLYSVSGGDFNIVSHLYGQLKTSGRFEASEKMSTAMLRDLATGWCSESDCLAEIKTTFKNLGYILDPHTAVAKHVLRNSIESDRPVIISSTAHYSKFPESVSLALGLPPQPTIGDQLTTLAGLRADPAPRLDVIDTVKKTRVHTEVIEAQLPYVKDLLLEFASKQQHR